MFRNSLLVDMQDVILSS